MFAQTILLSVLSTAVQLVEPQVFHPQPALSPPGDRLNGRRRKQNDQEKALKCETGIHANASTVFDKDYSYIVHVPLRFAVFRCYRQSVHLCKVHPSHVPSPNQGGLPKTRNC